MNEKTNDQKQLIGKGVPLFNSDDVLKPKLRKVFKRVLNATEETHDSDARA